MRVPAETAAANAHTSATRSVPAGPGADDHGPGGEQDSEREHAVPRAPPDPGQGRGREAERHGSDEETRIEERSLPEPGADLARGVLR